MRFLFIAIVCALGSLLFFTRFVEADQVEPESLSLDLNNYQNRIATYYDLYGDNLNDGEAGPGKEALRGMRIWHPRLIQNGDIAAAANAINNYNCSYQYRKSPYDPQWTSRGPIGKPEGRNSTGNGQVHRVVFDPQYDGVNNQTVYCISHFGGLWRSETEDVFWENVNTDVQLPFCTVSDVTIHPENSSILFIATGDGDFGRIIEDDKPSLIGGLSIGPTQSSGIYRSLDKGGSWAAINGADFFCSLFERGGNIRAIEVDPDNPQRLFTATTHGIFLTENALAAPEEVVWRKVLQVKGHTEWRELIFKPGDAQTVYASGEDIFRSTDGGLTWHSLTSTGQEGLILSELPTAPIYLRINITATPADPDRLYAEIFGVDHDLSCEDCKAKCKRVNNCNASACNHAQNWSWVYVFKDNKWYKIREQNTCTTIRAQQRRWMGLAASPVNPNTVFCGQTVVYGTDPDCTWETLISGDAFYDVSGYNRTGIHADIHDLTFEPARKNQNHPWLWATTHGGVSQMHLNDIAQKTSHQKLWHRVDDGLEIATVWDVDQSSIYPEQIVTALQDNGVIIQKRDSSWKQILQGDGYAAMFDPISNEVFMRNQNSMYRLDYPTGKYSKEDQFLPDDPVDGYRTFLRAFEGKSHPESDAFYTAFGEIYRRKQNRPHRKTKSDDVWEIKSDIGKSVGGAWKRMILSFEIAEENPEMVYVLSTGVDGIYPDTWYSEPRLFYSTHGGCTDMEEYGSKKDPLSCFSEVPMPDIDPDHPGDTKFPLMQAIAVNPANANEVFVVFSGYDPRYKVWSWNYDPDSDTGTWRNEDPNGSLNNLPVNQIIYQKGTDGRLYIGTDAGIWIRDEGKTNWERYGDFPNVRVLELNVNYTCDELMAGTFGRGVWTGKLLEKSTDYPTARVLTATDTIIWDQNRALQRPLRITDGTHLKIKNARVSLPADGHIYIEPGATLHLENAVLHNPCQEIWSGVYLAPPKTKRGKVEKLARFLRDKKSTIINTPQALHFNVER